MYSLDVIVIPRCLCRPPPRFDAIDAIYPLINSCRYISASLVFYLPILGSMGSGKSVSNTLTVIVFPAILYRAIGGIEGGLVLWDN